MIKSIKQSAALALLMFLAGIGFVALFTSSALDNTCTDFKITAMVTQPSSECSTFFNDIMLDSTIWLALWAVLTFFIFLIFIENILPSIEKKRKKKSKKEKKEKITKTLIQ